MTDEIDLVPSGDTPEDAIATVDSTTEPLADLTAEQNADARKYAIEFLSKTLRLRGVRVAREDYLRQELRKLGASDQQIDSALETTPLSAGIALKRLDELAASSIDVETRKSAAISFFSGIPGGFAILATVPVDVTQYYVHALRIIQKLAYLYGWQDLLGDLDEADDETVGRLALFFGVMMGVGGASLALSNFASQVAVPAMRKRIARKALTKTAWYTPMKRVLALIGVKVTKESFAKTVAKAVPLAGGVVSGAMTLVALKSQSTRLLSHLRELPPPGIDAAEYAEALAAAESIEESSTIAELARATADIREATHQAAAGAQGVAARTAANTGAAAQKLVGDVLGRFIKPTAGEGAETSD